MTLLAPTLQLYASGRWSGREAFPRYEKNDFDFTQTSGGMAYRPWLDVRRELKACGPQAGPRLAVGDGALGFWSALD
ncbi:MAG: hypothetical protein IPN92_10030 [Chromatiaceae bacterium]|nr:hypothetical protein [Chromatiaceae bacterium]